MTDSEKLAIIINNMTTEYFNYIKSVLETNSRFVEYVNDISFVYDRDTLEALCKNEGINIKYTSTHGDDNRYDPYRPMNKIIYSYETKIKQKIM